MAETGRVIWRLFNQVRNYPWGSHHAIAELLGQDVPSAEPQAELWMGGHAQGSSSVEIEGRQLLLRDVLQQDPSTLLGLSEGAGRPQDVELPFLFKVLAAGAPLSVQAHPNRQQAIVGFEREEAAGLDRLAGNRNYRDRNAKPEILLALTPFALIRGFREPDEILRSLVEVGLDPELAPLRALAIAGSTRPLRAFFEAFMALDDGTLEAIEAKVLGNLDRKRAEHRWVGRLAEHYPGDRGILAPLWLHFVELQPGQAIFTPPCILHAYLEGVGMELMSSSDNVLRGGLTSKHVDVAELLEVVRFEPQPPEITGGRPSRTTGIVAAGTVSADPVSADPVAADPVAPRPSVETCFDVPTNAFSLSRLDLNGDRQLELVVEAAEILLCGEGSAELWSRGTRHPVKRGDAFFVAARAQSYRLQGHGVIFRARGPLVSRQSTTQSEVGRDANSST